MTDTGTARLDDLIKVKAHFQRSVNLERDADSEAASYYIPTARALDTIRRWALAMTDSSRPRAWSITGPYGSGKSSFALYVEALAGDDRSPIHQAAFQTLSALDSELVDLVRAGRSEAGADGRGFILAVATAEREPAVKTLVRALAVGAERYWPTRMPVAVVDALAKAEAAPSGTTIIGCLRALSDRAPVLLVVDEFGKNLEAFSDAGAAGDLFVLQELAEQVAGRSGVPVFLFTLQHLAFSDYAAHLSEQQRREWSKVQGRFEDVPFLDSPDQAIHVLAGAFDRSGCPPALRRRIEVWARRTHARYSDLGLASYFGSTPDLISGCYPLHPVAVAALPELCARYAQNSRTLFSFVAGREPGSVLSKMASADPSASPLPVVTLEDVYAYFVESAGTMISASRDSSRWLEIERRLRETQGLDEVETRCLRIVAILNLISGGGALRASRHMLEALLADGGVDANPDRLIGGLVERGLLTYRDFADEFRIWQGSDFDIPAAVAEARERLSERPIADLLEAVAGPAPVVAARHSQRIGILRYFAARFADETTESIQPTTDADGILVYQVGDLGRPVLKALSTEATPVVLVTAVDLGVVRDAALDLAAHQDVLTRDPRLSADWVARRELQEREGMLRQRLAAVIRSAFGPGSRRVLAKDGSQLDGAIGLTRLVSELCDQYYSKAPEVRNEMIARRELTSQGAKARRELLTAMITKTHVERLGLSGYGPERAMYEAILHWPGLHREAGEGFWAFQTPLKGSSWQGAWTVLERLVLASKERPVSAREVWNALASPPVGLKDGVIVVVFTAALLHWADEVAIYQDGTYQPVLDAALVERLLKTPERFSIKAFGLAGVRGAVLNEVGATFGITGRVSTRRRNSTVLTIMSPLLTRLRALPAYSQRTKHISPSAASVRQALASAREPDQLLFVDLPVACEVAPFEADRPANDQRAKEFASRLWAAAAELESAYPNLLAKINDGLVREFGVPATVSLRQGLRGRAALLVDAVLDPKLRSPLQMACNESLEDQEWLEAMAMTIGDKPPQDWRDEDLDNFGHSLRAVATSFARVEALHFDRRAVGHEGFDARRVTVTSPDGTEVSRVVYVNDQAEDAVEAVVDSAVSELEAWLGEEAGPALIAVLARRMYQSVADVTALPEEIANV